MTRYYLHNGSQEVGPFNIEQLKSVALTEETRIWRKGFDHWTTAGEMPELSDLLREIKPPLSNKPSEKVNPQNLEHVRSTNSISNTSTGYSTTDQKPKILRVLIYALIGAVAFIGLLFYLNAKTIESINNKAQEQEKALSVEDSNRKNQELAASNLNYRNNWNDYIKATGSKYLYSESGGISGLEVMVTNKTGYMLDEVQVLIYYVKANGDNAKTETVLVYNVPALSSKSAPAPESEGGTSIRMDIQSIISKQMHFCYSTENLGNNPNDPYFCD
jgi:hypothetical protein